MARRSEISASTSLIPIARSVATQLADEKGDATASTIIVRRLLQKIESVGDEKYYTTTTDDPWSRLIADFFAADNACNNGEHRRSNHLSRLAALYEKLNQKDGIGAIYTPAWMATLMAQRALVAKLASTLCTEQAQIEALFINENVGCNKDGIATKRWASSHCKIPPPLQGGVRGGLHPLKKSKLLQTRSKSKFDLEISLNDVADVICKLTIIDPACGSGALLLAVAQVATRIMACAEPHDDSWRRDFLSNLSGFDIDPVAVDIARARLAAWAGVERDDPELRNIVVRDALNSDADIRHADICIMNPPYVPTYSRRSDSRVAATVNAYAKTHQLTGRLNLFGCFMHRALDITHTDSVVCAIVPDTFGSATAYEPLRAAWRQRFEQSHWLTVANNVFDAQVGSVVVTAGPAGMTKAPLQADELIYIEPIQLRQRVPAIAKDGRLLMFRNQTEQDIWQAVQDQPACFDEFVRSRDGVNTGPRYMRDILLDPQHVSPTVMPLIEGEDIAAQGYGVNPARRSIDYNPNLIDVAARRAGASLRDPEIFNRPKVVTRQTADTLIAAVEPHGGIVALNSVHCHQLLDAPVDLLWGLCAWLNAPLTRLYYALDGGEQRKVLPQVRIAWLRQLPVPREFLKCLRELAPLARTVAASSPAKAQHAFDHVHAITCATCGLGDKTEAVLSAYLDRFPRFAATPSRANPEHDASAA